MWRSVKTFSVLCTWGDVGGSGGRGTSAALLMARNDSSSEAVTRDAELQSGRRRMLCVYVKGLWEARDVVVVVDVNVVVRVDGVIVHERTPVAPRAARVTQRSHGDLNGCSRGAPC